jgi:uncharacterized protein
MLRRGHLHNPYTHVSQRFDPGRTIFILAMRNTLLPLSVAITFSASAQRVLHFTATSGYDHGTREVSLAMFTAIGNELSVEVVDAPTPSAFPEAAGLAEFDAIIFSNTSGNDILDASQRADLEAWVNAGGHVMGIHAATDTYRHSSANGNNTGTWDYYAELIGASVQENPNHVNGTPLYSMQHVGTHASTADLPDPWQKNEEYYYWEDGYYGPDNDVVLTVEETVGPNGQVNSYDAPRPMSWYRELPSGSRIFYTALGHATSNYTDDALFREHIKDALAWMLGNTVGIPGQVAPRPSVSPNPASEAVTVMLHQSVHDVPYRIIDTMGRIVQQGELTGDRSQLDVRSLPSGTYRLTMEGVATTPLHIMH